MGGSTPMDHAAAGRIGAAAGRDPQSQAAQSGFDGRAEPSLTATTRMTTTASSVRR
jgi:hypothetical protein